MGHDSRFIVRTQHVPPSLLDWIRAAITVAIFVPTSLVICLLRRAVSKNDGVPLQRDLLLSVARSTVMLIPLSVKRSLSHPKSVQQILQSQRFGSYKQEFCQRVATGTFVGHWVCKGFPDEIRDPKDSDIILFSIHGGAYVLGHPSASFVQLLRTAEVVAQHGLTISIFCLEYSLAPEATFPKQIEEAMAAYQYVTKDVDPSKVVLTSESAGGHLVLSLLHGLRDTPLRKPGAALLLFPWVDLTNSGASFDRNRSKDLLTKESLDVAVRGLMGANGWSRFAPIVDFSAPKAPGYWKETLPRKTWVQIGTHEVFLDSVTAFARQAKEDGADVHLEVTPDVPHGYLLALDFLNQKRYLDSVPSMDARSLLQASTQYSETIVSLVKAQQ